MGWPEPTNSWITYMQVHVRWLAQLAPPDHFPTRLWEIFWDEGNEREGWPELWWEEYMQEARVLGNQDRVAARGDSP